MGALERPDAGGSVAIDGKRFWFRDGVDAGALAFGRAVLQATLDEAGALKRGRRKMLFELDHGGRTFLIKVNRYPTGPRGWLRRSKARREWQRAASVVERGVATPLFVAMAEERTWTGRLLRCIAVVERITGASDLGERWRRARPGWAEQKQWARALGALARQMHDAGVLQRDFAPNNLLVLPNGPGPRFVPIDFERTELVRRVDPKGAATTLAKLHRYLYDAPRTLWWRFLLEYCRGHKPSARALAQRVAAETPELFRRDLAHLRRTVGRKNRRFRPLSAGGWAHRGISDTELETALRGEASWRFWQSGVDARSSRRAFDLWALAQALSQREGLIAKPLALAGPRADTPEGWVLVSARSSGEEVWPDTADPRRAASLRVLTRRVCALGVAAPIPAEVLYCAEGPGARLRAAPASGP